MHVPLSVYITVVLVGCLVLSVFARISPITDWWRGLAANRFYAATIIAVWGILLWPQSQADAYVQGSEMGALRAVRILVFTAVFGIACVRILRIGRYPRTTLLAPYVLYVAICGASAAYSPAPLETLWKAFELVVVLTVAFAWLLGTKGSPSSATQLLHGLLFVMFAVVVWALVGVALFPNIAYRLWDGVREVSTASASGIVPSVNANTLGQLAGTVFVAGAILLLEPGSRFGGVLVAAVGLAGLIAAHSRTSLVAAAAITAAVLWAQRRLRAMTFAVPLVAAAAFLGADVLGTFFARGQDLDALRSMTGRAHMWAIAWEAFLGAPWLGSGFYAGHKALALYDLVEFYSSLDNTYLEALVDVGIIGTVGLVYFGLSVGVRSWCVLVGRVPIPLARWDGALLFILAGFVLIRSVTGPTYQVLHINVTVMLTCAVALAVFRGAKRSRRAGAAAELSFHQADRNTI
jgi:O-antigen ligase